MRWGSTRFSLLVSSYSSGSFAMRHAHSEVTKHTVAYLCFARVRRHQRAKRRMKLYMKANRKFLSESNDEGNVASAAMIGLFAAAVLVLGGIVLFGFLGGTTSSLAANTKNTSSNISNSDWGSPTANSIAPSFSLIVSLGGIAIPVVGLGILGYAVWEGMHGRRFGF